MKTYRQQLIITTDQPEQFLNLSYEVEECVRRSLINDGLCVVYSQHTTSAVFLDNDREELYSDWSEMLGKIIPKDSRYKVDYSSAGASHMKQILLGAGVTVPISDGRLELGVDLLGYAQDSNSMTTNWAFSLDLLHGAVTEENTYEWNIDTDRIQTALEKVNAMMASAAALAIKKACSVRKENELFL